MAENPMTREELEEAFWRHRWPVNDILIDHVFQEYHAGPDAGLYTDADAWEQTRKLAAYFEDHGELPGKLSDWMPGWGDVREETLYATAYGGVYSIPTARAAHSSSESQAYRSPSDPW